MPSKRGPRLFRKNRLIGIALAVTVIYLIAMLAPVIAVSTGNLQSSGATISCSEDCALCGCLPEESARHACCCWKTKAAKAFQSERSGHHDDHGNDERVIVCTTPCGSKHMASPNVQKTDQIVPVQNLPLKLVRIGQTLPTYADLYAALDMTPPHPPPEISC